MLSYNDITVHCRYIITDRILLAIIDNNKINLNINVNVDDYMYGIIICPYTMLWYIDYIFIHCNDMINLYKDFVMNKKKLYQELKNKVTNIHSFIRNIHKCEYALTRLISKSIPHDQLWENLIAFTNK